MSADSVPTPTFPVIDCVPGEVSFDGVQCIPDVPWLDVPTTPAPPTTIAVTTTVDLCPQEDMECWDCSTMGNLICGTPVVAVGSPPLPSTGADVVVPAGLAGVCIVVGVVFARLARRPS